MTDDLKKDRESGEELEPERLVGAADEDPSSEALSRAWAKTQGALAQSNETPAQQATNTVPIPWQRPRVEWWVASFVMAAALFMFAVLLGRQSGVPLSMPTGQVPGGDSKSEPSEADVARWIAHLKDEEFSKRQEVWRKLLRGGARARQAVKDFKSSGDAEQDKLVEELRNAHEVLAELQTIPDPESLAFWRAVWRVEVATQPNLWSTGIAMNKADPVPAAPPSKLMQEVFDARFGEEKAREVAARFRKAFDALQAFTAWHRVLIDLDPKKQVDLAAERRRMDALLQGVADAGNAAAPVVFSILQVNAPMMAHAPRPKNTLVPYWDDHLRMIVAAEKLRFPEAVPILMKQFIRGGYPSPTIQANAWAAVWRICGHEDKAPVFPFDVGDLTQEQADELWAFWVDREVKTWVPRLGDEDHEKREEAQRKLVELGSRVKAAIEKLPPVNDPEVAARLKRIRELYFIAADCKTAEEAIALLERQNAELYRQLSSEPATVQAEQVKKIEDTYARIQALSKPEVADLVVANLRYKEGMQAYGQFRDGDKGNLSQVLKRASLELEKAVALYDKHLKANPNDKLAQDRQAECNMVQYACKKYGAFEPQAAAEEKPVEAKKEAAEIDALKMEVKPSE